MWLDTLSRMAITSPLVIARLFYSSAVMCSQFVADLAAQLDTAVGLSDRAPQRESSERKFSSDQRSFEMPVGLFPTERLTRRGGVHQALTNGSVASACSSPISGGG